MGSSLEVALGAPQRAARHWLRTLQRAELASVPGVDELAGRALWWFALAALAYRVALTPIMAAGALGNRTVQVDVPTSLLLVMGLVLLGDLVLLVGISLGRLAWLLRSRAFFAVDVSVPVALNLWAVSTLRPGTFFWPGHGDVVHGYLLGAAALWTGVRGARTGFAMIALGTLLQVAMGWANRAVFDFASWMTLVARVGWLVASVLLSLMLMTLARQGARLAASEGVRAGREAERARLLRETHDTVLQTLEAIALQAGADAMPMVQRLGHIEAAARGQASMLRTVLREDTVRASGGLAGGLRALADEFLGQGLHTELVTEGLTADPPPAVSHAMLRAAREALTNVVKHAAVDHVVVRAVSRPDLVELVVRDQGIGFDTACRPVGFGMDHSIRARMRDVGGIAEIWSEPCRGTRVTLRSSEARP